MTFLHNHHYKVHCYICCKVPILTGPTTVVPEVLVVLGVVLVVVQAAVASNPVVAAEANSPAEVASVYDIRNILESAYTAARKDHPWLEKSYDKLTFA